MLLDGPSELKQSKNRGANLYGGRCFTIQLVSWGRVHVCFMCKPVIVYRHPPQPIGTGEPTTGWLLQLSFAASVFISFRLSRFNPYAIW